MGRIIRNTLGDIPELTTPANEPVEEAAVAESQQLTRKHLGELFDKTHETIRRWESGRNGE